MSEEMREMLIKLTKICNRASRNAVYEYKGTISMTPPPEWEAFNPAEHIEA